MGAAGRGGLEKGDCNWAIGPRSPQAGGGRLTEAWNWGSWRELSQARRPPRGWDRVVGSGSGWVEGGSKAISGGCREPWVSVLCSCVGVRACLRVNKGRTRSIDSTARGGGAALQ